MLYNNQPDSRIKAMSGLLIAVVITNSMLVDNFIVDNEVSCTCLLASIIITPRYKVSSRFGTIALPTIAVVHEIPFRVSYTVLLLIYIQQFS